MYGSGGVETKMEKLVIPNSTTGNVQKTQNRNPWVIAARVSLVLTYILITVLTCIVIWQLVAARSERHIIAWAVGAICVAIALPLSLHDVTMHLLHFTSPLQRFYIRILWMVPIYSVESWCALRFTEQAIYFQIARESYEAYVIHSFFKLLLEFLGSKENAIQILRAKATRTGHSTAHMLAPFCCLRPWKLNGEFLNRTRLCVFQYVIVRLVMAAAVFIASIRGEYEEGQWDDPTNLFIYNVVILNFSQLVALWALLMFYHELSEELQQLSPFPKFMAVKAVVFFSFWQSMVISGLSFANVIKPSLDFTQAEVANGIQDFMICFEMVLAALSHRWLFSYRDFYREPGDGKAPIQSDATEFQSFASGFISMLPGDVVQEAAGIAASGIKNAQKSLNPRVVLLSAKGGSTSPLSSSSSLPEKLVSEDPSKQEDESIDIAKTKEWT